MAQRTPSIDEPGGARDAEDVDGTSRTPDGEEPGGAERRSTATVAETVHRAPTPFVWQHGRRLLLLDDEQRGWVMAELRFDVERCRYVEVRRATYRWPREAVGAILSRALASGYDAAEDSACSLRQWLSRYYGFALYAEPSGPPSADASDLSP
ncbi:MAG: hypothetical protein QOF33_844 [Thermomicrobiales bacterium]|jgi:hypothetical protein|nr:hypothetical protein [Thermomicrobiales bacterium]